MPVPCQDLREPKPTRLSRTYLLAGLALALGLVAFALRVAWAEWFSREDFYLLLLTHKPEWTWAQIFLPLDLHFQFVYRPVGYEGWFKLWAPLFGTHAFPYLAASLTVHFATGLVVLRLARQLGYAREVALATALLSVSLAPTLSVGYRAVMCHYMVAGLGLTLAVSWLHDWARTGSRPALAGALASFTLAIFSNEFVVGGVLAIWATALAAQRLPATVGTAWLAFRWTVPFLVISLCFLALRGVVTAGRGQALYVLSFGENVLSNLAWIVPATTGSGAGLYATAVLALAVLGLALCDRETRAHLEGRQLSFALAGAWAVGVVSPFLGLPFMQPRFAIPLEVPFALAVGAALDTLWARFGDRAPTALQAGMLALVLAVVPYGSLLERLRASDGAVPRSLVELVRQTPPGTLVRIRYGAPERASRSEAEELRRLVYGGGIFAAILPDRGHRMKLLQTSPGEPPEPCTDCLELDLLPGGALVEAARPAD